MPISRCQIRNEYRLADPELYRAADKDDPEALLEGIAMAGLVGVLRQLGDLAEFAAEIFHDLHEEVMATAARGHGLMNRVQQIESEFPSIEKVFLSQTNHLSFFTNTGIDWHPNLRSEQNLVTRGDLPRFVMDSYEECRGPPRLFLLDKFDVAGAGACLKRYTDPSFFKMEAPSSGSRVARVEVHREKRIRKAKKKGTHRRNGETTPDIAPTHAKLHQLLLEERIEDAYNNPARLIKLKKRQLNGSTVEAKTRKSYLEKFLESPSPDHKMVCETSILPLPAKSMSDDASETGVRILEVSIISPVRRSLGFESTCSSPTEQVIGLKPSSDMDRETDDLVKVHEQMDAGVMDEMFSNHLDVPQETELTVNEQKREGSIDEYHSDDVTSEVDNYLDALTTMDSEMETENEFRPKKGFLHMQKVTDTGVKEEHQELQSRFSDSQSFRDSPTSGENSSFKRERNGEHADLRKQFSESRSIGTSSTSDGNSSSKRDTHEEYMELQAHFSDSQSIGNLSTSDEYSSFNKDRSLFSQGDSLSTIVENIQSDGCVAPMLLSHTGHCASEIEDIASNKKTQMVVGSQKTNFVEFNMHEDTDTQAEEIPGSGQASSSSCLLTSDNIFLHSDPGATSSAVALSTEIHIDETPSDPVELHSRLFDDGDRDHVETMAVVPDALSLMKDDACSAVSSEKGHLNKLDGGDTHFNSDALLETSTVVELAPEDHCNYQSVVTVLSAEPQNKNSETFVAREISSPGERAICSSMGEVNLSAGDTLPLDVPDLKSEDCIVANQVNLEDLSPVVETTSTRMHCSDLNHETTEDEGDSGVEALYSDQQSNVEEISRMVHDDEISDSTYNVDAIEDDGRVANPSSVQKNREMVNDVITEQVQLEDATLSVVPSVDCAENQANFVTSSASDLISSPSSPSHNLDKSQETLPDSSDYCQMKMESNKVESTEIVEFELEKRGNQVGPSSYMTSNILSSSVSNITCSQESHSTFVDPQEEIDVNEAIAGESSTELVVQKVVNQLEVGSANVQSSPDRFLSCDPSDLEISNNNLALSSEEKIQYGTFDNNVTVVPGFSEMDTRELDSKSLCQNDVFLSGKDAISLSSYNHLESETPLELPLPSQVGQWDAEYLLTDEENSTSDKLESEQILTSNELKQERSFHIASETAEIHLDQPSSSESSLLAGKEINPNKHVMDSEKPVFPDLFPKAAEANVEETPPMPPLPPMQWRMGKVQHASFASQRESIEVNQASFQPTQPIGIDGKAQFGLLGSERESLQYHNPFLPLMAMESDKPPHSSGFSLGVSGHPFAIPLQFPVMVNDANSQYNYLLLERSQIQNPFLTVPVISTGMPSHGYIATSEEEVVQHSNQSSLMPPLEGALGHDSPQEEPVHPSSQSTIDTSSDQQSSSNVEPLHENAAGHNSPQEKLAQPSSPLRTDTSSEVKALRQSSVNDEVELRDPLPSSMSPPRTEAVQPHIGLLPPAGEMELPSDTASLISMFEGQNPNGKPHSKLPRPRNPLIDAVAAHDKSKMRKVTERVRTQIPPKEEERDSLLEQIRTKSFNLRPAVVKRPSMQHGPRTNLKVAAILEKANAIRQVQLAC